MIPVEERVAFLDGTVEGHSKMIDGVRDAVVSLEQRLDVRFAQFEERVDRRFASFEERLDRRFDRIDRRFDELDVKMSRQFHWLVGILMSGLIAMLGILGGVVSVLVAR